MRLYGLALSGLVLLAACGSKGEDAAGSSSGGGEFKASTPKEFWGSYQAAVKRKDAAALARNVYSKAVAKKQADDLRKGMTALQEKGDEEALIIFFEMSVNDPDGEEFVSADENEDRATIVFNRKRGSATDNGMKMYLVKEEGRWWQTDAQ